MDVSSVVAKYKPEFIYNPNRSDDRSSCVFLVESLDSPIAQQVSDPDEFDFYYEFFNSYDTKFVPTDSISYVDICFLFSLTLLIINPWILSL